MKTSSFRVDPSRFIGDLTPSVSYSSSILKIFLLMLILSHKHPHTRETHTNKLYKQSSNIACIQLFILFYFIFFFLSLPLHSLNATPNTIVIVFFIYLVFSSTSEDISWYFPLLVLNGAKTGLRAHWNPF